MHSIECKLTPVSPPPEIMFCNPNSNLDLWPSDPKIIPSVVGYSKTIPHTKFTVSDHSFLSYGRAHRHFLCALRPNIHWWARYRDGLSLCQVRCVLVSAVLVFIAQTDRMRCHSTLTHATVVGVSFFLIPKRGWAGTIKGPPNTPPV